MKDKNSSQTVRAAIYTRKSTEEGLEQEFNTLDAQRESGEAYIKSQQHEGWQLVPRNYDDGGFTGANMDRPALKRLMADIETGLVNMVLVYKVDRLSRSLLDFARMMEVFDRKGVAFVSVTQQFNSVLPASMREAFWRTCYRGGPNPKSREVDGWRGQRGAKCRGSWRGERRGLRSGGEGADLGNGFLNRCGSWRWRLPPGTGSVGRRRRCRWAITP